MTMCRRQSVLLLALALAWAPAVAVAQTPAAPPVAPLSQIYQLETVELTGTTRMTSAQLADELGLVKGTPLNDEFVMSTRSRL